MSTADHRKMALQKGPISVAIVTVSDTRTKDTDVNAQYFREQLEAGSHRCVAYHLIKDEPEQVETVLEELCASEVQTQFEESHTNDSC